MAQLEPYKEESQGVTRWPRSSNDLHVYLKHWWSRYFTLLTNLPQRPQDKDS